MRVVRYDARGHGRSPVSFDPDAYRWPALAEDLFALADVSGLDRFVAGGASMGCATALHAAVQAPERIEGLLLVIPPTAWSTRPGQARLYRAGARMIDAVGLRPFALLARAVPKPAVLRHRPVVPDDLADRDRAVVAAILRGAAVSDLPATAELARLDVPALVLAWAGDPTHPLSTGEALASCLPRATLDVAREPEDLDRWPALVCRFLQEG